MDTLAPILRTAWQARTRAIRVFGTMMGTAEILQLLFADCDSHFVEWFSRREVTPEEQQAFEEFLFDVPTRASRRCATACSRTASRSSTARRSRTTSALARGALRPTVGEAKELYVAFRRRRVRAQYRASTGAPGPRRTAEGYLMEAILRHQLPEGAASTPLE